MSLHKKITISDIAAELGVSKTTVSRTISGKGRIGEETRTRILSYLKDTDYMPDQIARRLAQSKTYNISVVIPEDSSRDVPFFQTCLIGICEVVNAENYDVIVSMVSGQDISQLERLVEKHKVDGVVLTCAFINDPQISYLKKVNVPFVLIGSSAEEGVIQIDSDHMSACTELTSRLIRPSCQSIAYLAGDPQHTVEQKRYQGFRNGFEQEHLKVDESLVFLELTTKALTEQAVGEAIQKEVDCMVCSDDRICGWVLSILNEKNLSVPKDICVASFYNSEFLQNYNPKITAIDFNAKDWGYMAGKQILRLLDGQEVSKRMLLNYRIQMNPSTQR